jgi:shikimate dehydrogenase
MATAPGQPTLARALELGLPNSADCAFIGLIGDERIRHSKGTFVYNRLFRQKLLPWSYIPLPTIHPLETIALAKKLGAIGASATIPHKEVLAHNFPCDKKAAIGATNTLKFLPSGNILASNTDIAGFAIPLIRAEAKRRWTCLILGAGGAARAAVEACHQLGLKPIIAARDVEKALRIFQNISVVPWESRTKINSEILINTTPLCGSNLDLWPDSKPINKCIVFDCAVSPEVSQLITKAKQEGAITINSTDMWIVQGIRQMHLILGIAFEESELREQL